MKRVFGFFIVFFSILIALPFFGVGVIIESIIHRNEEEIKHYGSY